MQWETSERGCFLRESLRDIEQNRERVFWGDRNVLCFDWGGGYKDPIVKRHRTLRLRTVCFKARILCSVKKHYKF